MPTTAKKSDVRAYWNDEPYGTRGVDASDRLAWFREIEEQRYELEPYIPPFARFDEARGKRVLEIGIGVGTDFVQWVRAGAIATGVDLPHALSSSRARAWLWRVCTRLFRKQTQKTSRSETKPLTWSTRGVLFTIRPRQKKQSKRSVESSYLGERPAS